MPLAPIVGAFLIAALSVVPLRVADVTPAPTGDAIFAAAQRAILNDSHPSFASYSVNVAFSKDGHRVHDSWSTFEDIAHATVLTGIFSKQEIANPNTPHGVNVVVQFFGTINPANLRNPMGIVSFAIDQTYGIAPQHTYLTAANLSDFYHGSRAITIIGGTAKTLRRYDVTLVDTVDGDAGEEYHLKLTPLINPTQNRLRELWIDTETLAVHSALVAGIGHRAPTTRVLWKVDFEPHEGATYLSREVALEPLDYGKQGVLKNVTIDFADVHLISGLAGSRIGLGIGMQTPVDPVHDP